MQQKPSNQEIYKYIGELLLSQDFKLAQSEFFDTNCHHFEDEDENKHIYQQIYTEYTQILEQSIESKLEIKFPGTDFSPFFEDLENNTEQYTKIDKDTLEILFSFTDFEKFKKLMLQYNQKGSHNKQTEETKVQGGQDFGTIEKFYAIELPKWKQILKGKTENEISLFTLPYENTGLDMIRGEVTWQGVTVQAATDGLFDPTNPMIKQNKKIKEFKEVKKIAQDDSVFYIRVAPPVISERELLLNIQKIRNGSESSFIKMRSIELPEYPENNNAVRADVLRGFKVTAVPGQKAVKLSVIGYQDFKGYIPKMFMNLFMSKMVSGMVGASYKLALQKQESLDKK